MSWSPRTPVDSLFLGTLLLSLLALEAVSQNSCAPKEGLSNVCRWPHNSSTGTSKEQVRVPTASLHLTFHVDLPAFLFMTGIPYVTINALRHWMSQNYDMQNTCCKGMSSCCNWIL